MECTPPLPPFLSGASPPVSDPGEGPRGPAPPLIFRPKIFWRPPPPPHHLKVWIRHCPPKKNPGSPPLVTQNVSIVLTNKQVLIEFSIFYHATPEIRLLSLKGYPPK